MLNSLEIRNFKLIKSLKIDKLSKVNLITGKNNTGKSTVLEAIYLLVNKGNIKILTEVLRERGEINNSPNMIGEDIFETNMKRLSSLFHQRKMDFESNNHIYIGDNSKKKKNSSITIKIISSLSEIKENTLTNSQNDTQNIFLSIFSDKFKEQKYDLNKDFVRSFGFHINLKLEKIQFVKTSNLDNNINGELWDNISLSDNEKYVTEALQLIEPKIQRIAFVSNGSGFNRNAIIRIQDSTEVLTIKSMGDGINRILTIILALVNSENGYLLIDEFENGLHYSIHSKLWEIIFFLSEKLNVQVFATTHSMDCINGFSDILNQNKKNEGKLIRLDKKNDVIVNVEYDKTKLEIATNNFMEVR